MGGTSQALNAAPDGAMGERRSSAARPPKDALLEDPVLRAAVLEQLTAPLAPLEEETARAFGRELVKGDWKLVQRFDRDGRRFFVWQRNDAQTGATRALTDRERLVLSRVARGLGDRAVAIELGCSTSTIATHRLRAMAKLGVTSRTVLAQVLSGILIAENAR